jgi:methyl-accepting chemotaxis protein
MSNQAARREDILPPTPADPGASPANDAHQSTLREISDNVIETVTAMTDASGAVDKIGHLAAPLSDYSSTIASAGEELSATIYSINQNVESTMAAAAEAREYAANGTTVIDNTVSRINAVDTVLRDATQALRGLLDVADQADTIIRVVHDISAKTDLLALNASIEAARAGSAGRGFAVVAHEVGRLSEKTQASITEIEGIINSIKRNVSAVSQSIESGSESAHSAVEEVSVAKTAIDDIVVRIDCVNDEVTNIGSAIKEQSIAVTDIADNITTISKSSATVKDEIGRVSNQVDAVTRRANETRNSLGRLDIGRRALLQQSKVDHLFWMYRLRRMVEGKETIREEEFVDHTKCRLGKWYKSQDPSALGQGTVDIFHSIDAPHAKLHRLAAEAIRAYNTGSTELAATTFTETLAISVDIVELLDRLAARVED